MQPGAMCYDMYLQVNSHDTVAKLHEYFKAPGLHVFPPDFADQCEEVGPCNRHTGPCLALFRGVRIPREGFLTWLQDHPFLSRQINRVFFFPSSNQTKLTSREELLQDISNSNAPPHPLRISAFPKDLETYLSDNLPLEFEFHPKEFTEVLMAVETEGRLCWSIVPSHLFYCLSSTIPKVFEGSVASAMNKLHEAIEVLGLHACKQSMRAAIDVGAAPGSWTSFFARTAQTVIAIDPAELSPEVASLPNVHHVQMMSNDLKAASAICTALGSAVSLVDLIACDMNKHPFEASKLVQPLLKFLRPGGVCILTMKMRGFGRDRSKTFNKLKEIFADTLEDARCLWLLSNTKSETTFVAKKCGSS